MVVRALTRATLGSFFSPPPAFLDICQTNRAINAKLTTAKQCYATHQDEPVMKMSALYVKH